MPHAYHVDAGEGDDRRDGRSPEQAWRSLGRAMRQRLEPGDRLLLKRGCSFKGPLRIKGRGRRGRPIVLGAYGAGPKPRVLSDSFPVLSNNGPVSWWEVKGLEVAGRRPWDPWGRRQGERHGIHFHQAGLSEGMLVEDCVVHDVDGAGITFSAARQGSTAYRGWTVRRCEVYNAGTGIATQGPWPPVGDLRRVYRCHERFTVEHCDVHHIATDGIVLYYCQDGVIQHCRAWRTGLGRWHRTPVGIWLFMAARCAIQFCESWDNHAAGGHADGGGFDLDGGCVDCVMQYNYSHDNDGAGFLICSYDPAKAPTRRCTTRFNLSVNDGRMNDYAAIQIWQADDCRTYNNTCITRISSSLKFASDSRGHLFANNLFIIDADQDIPHIQCEFEMPTNRFINNLYWKRDGKAWFKLKGALHAPFGAQAGRFRSSGEAVADPLLRCLDGPAAQPRAGSRALKGGRRVAGMGRRDLLGTPIAASGPVPQGALVKAPIAGAGPTFQDR